MGYTDREVQALREQTLVVDPKTGETLRKPSPPPMRKGVRGAWTYREEEPKVPPDERKAPRP